MGSTAEELSLLAIGEATAIPKMALVSIQNPEQGTGLPQSLYMKARHPRQFFVFAGLNHAAKLSEGRVPTPSLVEQVQDFVQMGCDGIKMIEGKPTSRQRMDVPVTDAYFADYWACVEEMHIPIVWHVNDPEEFWDPERIPGWAKKRNWGYGPGDVQKEQLYAEVDTVLDRHPGLQIVFAHFYFLSADLPRARRFLDQHPAVRFDLAPGIEMLYNLSHDAEASRTFFIDYADRIVFGTDIFSKLTPAEARGRAGILFRWLETEDTFRVPQAADFLLGPPEDGIIRGMCLPDDVLDRAYHDNWIALAGSEPAVLDTELVIETCERINAIAKATCERINAIAKALSGNAGGDTEAARVAKALAVEP